MTMAIPAGGDPAPAVERVEVFSAKEGITAAWLALVYVVTRAGNLSRELVSEEGFFLAPGMTLLRSGEFDFFSKPPLTSLLLGLGSTLGHDPFSAARLVPFLTGLFVCLYIFRLSRSVVPSVIVLLAPFMFSASGHMQTDSTVGLLGYTLVCGAILCWFRDEQALARKTLAWGLLILWLGKLEIAVIATTALGAAALLLPASRRASFVRFVAILTVAGVGLFVAATGILGFTAGRPISGSAGKVVGTILRIGGSLTESSLKFSADSPRGLILRLLAEVQLPELLIITCIPIAYFALRLAPGASLRKAVAALAIAAALPLTVYLIGGYPGDGFPRYFLIVIPPLLLALGISLRELDARRRRLWSVILVLTALSVFGPETWRLWKAPGSVSVHRQTHGYREAASFVGAITRLSDLVLVPEAASHYLKGRRMLVVEEFEPYPSTHTATWSRRGEIKAAIMPILPPEHPLNRGIAGRLVRNMEASGTSSFRFGTVEVILSDAVLQTQLEGTGTIKERH